LAGEDAVKTAGERYLPKFDSQTADEFDAYRNRASFFNATGRTLDGYCGLIFRRDPFVKVPEGTTALAVAFDEFVKDCDMLGTSPTCYGKDLVKEIITVGRAGSLVDWEGEFENRAYVSLYQAEQIINWRVDRVNGRSVPTLIVLKETATVDNANDAFVSTTIPQIRVLKLVRGASGTGQANSSDAKQASSYAYQVEIWQQLARGQGANKKEGQFSCDRAAKTACSRMFRRV
jgi:hypothetical protein